MAKQRDQQSVAQPVVAGDGRVAPQGCIGTATPSVDPVRDRLDAEELHTLARDLFISAAPSHRGSGRTEEQLARECYVFARAFLKVRAEQSQESTP